MDAAVASGAGTGATGGAMSAGETEERKMMRLHILSGSFVPADDAGGGGCPMDLSVWSRTPEDIMWRVLGFVPAAKRFQLHSVSRKWQRELTSAHFRNRIAAADSSESSRQQQQEVVACVTPADESRSKLKVVEVDLSFVPDWFWNPNWKGSRSYSVVAAGEGLVCISNHMEFTCNPREFPPWEQPLPGESWPALYCLLNPLTRTCVVVPPPPFQPLGWLSLSPAAPTIYGWDDQNLQVATFEGLGTWLHSSAHPTQRRTNVSASKGSTSVLQREGQPT